jgi:hypothetical protein
MILKFSIFVANFFATNPNAQFEIEIGIFEVLLLYFALILLVGFLEWINRKAGE